MTTASIAIPSAVTGPDAPAATPAEQAAQAAAKPTDQNAPARPDWVPEKFWKGDLEKSSQELAKAYSELEKKQSAPKQPDPPPTVDEAKKAEAVVEKAGLSFDKYTEAFAKEGKLSDDHYAELAKAGIPKEMVDTYIAGQQVLADNVTSTLFAAAGGQENYGAMVTWASQNLTPAEQAAYNKVMDSGDTNAAALAITGLKARFEDANGKDPTRTLNGGTGLNNGQTSDTFQSWAQVTEAMRDPKYKVDPAYRDAVTKKLGRSKL